MIVHLPHGFTPPIHVKLKNPKKDAKNIVCLSVMEIFRSTGNHLHIGINQKRSWGYVVPKSWRWQMSSRHPWNNSTVNQLRAHQHIWINPIIAKFFESKSSMWQDITKPNMKKRNSWNNVQNHLNWCQRGLNELFATRLWHIRHSGLSHIVLWCYDLVLGCVVLNPSTNSKLCGKEVRIPLGCNFHQNGVTCIIRKLVLPNHELLEK